ncbi:hypothetical protein RMSM_07716 [Rhodopirellula maiorica SM1]|uniref:GYF domain-containing protein n=2 Tax=Novipirellula TaxID=2795426 RepID=M5RJ39_9BACT|nr:hypothetical protein RMSM_07716 [Rhodopirellula maiorica SM1]
MGIRFACHVCNKQLNIKSELAGRRGVCPSCASRFRIPLQDCPKSTPVETRKAPVAAESQAGAPQPQSAAPQRKAAAVASDSSGDDITASVAVASASGGNERTKSSSALFDGESTWYVRPPSGGQYGPASEEVFREWITEGRVAATALVWRDGWAEWRDAIDVLPELSGRGAMVSVASPRTNHVGDTVGRFPLDSTATNHHSGDLASTATEVYGNRQIGAIKRKRFLQRAATITALSIVAIGLVAALLAVAGR